MNNLLELNGKFQSRRNPNRPGTPSLPSGTTVSSERLRKLAEELSETNAEWGKQNVLKKELIAVHQTRIIPKSKRVKVLFSGNGITSDQEMRGAYYEKSISSDEGTEKLCHVFIYYVSRENVLKSIAELEKAAQVIDTYYRGEISFRNTGVPRTYKGEKITPKPYPAAADSLIHKTSFYALISECFYIHSIAMPQCDLSTKTDHIIRIYHTDGNIQTMLAKYGIPLSPDFIIDENTAKLSDEEVSALAQSAPFLVAMSVVDAAEIPKIETVKAVSAPSLIEPPGNEPIVGVIDTLFDTNAYCHEWVDYHEMIDPSIIPAPDDYRHGTYVTSIIVDGQRCNPSLDDGCGHFRVRHFGIVTGEQFSILTVIQKIEKIVKENQDIRVWNLSLGTKTEIDQNSISPVAAKLDELQEEYNIVFVVAGTNKPEGIPAEQNYHIGSPADSINSIVVNSVDLDNRPASYTRTGPVLSFYNKPDVSCFGGDGVEAYGKMKVYDPISQCQGYTSGTSLAAPWITRKMAYLIQVLGLTRETAKALLIDSACSWKGCCDEKTGYGVVPVRIEDVLNADDDEIKFYINGISSAYETYNFNIPVPFANDQFPYYARATMVYYPHCNPDQGVDYTGTELDVHFGRINDKKEISDIKNNHQSEEGLHAIYEKDARENYRKWDNVKHIADRISTGTQYPRKKYESDVWGIRVVRKERSSIIEQKPIRFGIVVTLKEMYGVNRYDEFIRACSLRNWIVNEIDINTRVNIYQKADEEIHLE